MKESERIKKEMVEDDSDNDFRVSNYFKKIERAERKESFEEHILPLLMAKYPVDKGDNKYEIITEKYGRIIFYPKANSLLITRNNSWIKHYALRWMTKWII
jgi:hypothetical protein